MPRQRQKRNKERKFLFVQDNASNERCKPLVLRPYLIFRRERRGSTGRLLRSALRGGTGPWGQYKTWVCWISSALSVDARFLVELHIIIGSFVTGLFQNIQERMKALVFVFVFVFVLVDEQAIST